MHSEILLRDPDEFLQKLDDICDKLAAENARLRQLHSLVKKWDDMDCLPCLCMECMDRVIIARDVTNPTKCRDPELERGCD